MNSLAAELEWSARGWKSRDIERKDMSEMLAARLASEERWMEKIDFITIPTCKLICARGGVECGRLSIGPLSLSPSSAS